MGSFGQILGTVAGAVVGFIIGGPGGAALGAAIGGGIGTLIDPPDMPEVGKPDLQELSITVTSEGPHIPDLVGTSKPHAGNIIQHWGNRSTEIIQESGGGKGGGGDSYVAGHNYYLSWIQGICQGPVDTLYTVFLDDNLVWWGELERTKDGQYSTITLIKVTGVKDENYEYNPFTWQSDLENVIAGDIIGTVKFYFGTDNQLPNDLIAAGCAAPEYNTPYRGLCYAFFDDFHLGTSNRAPVVKFIIGKYPDVFATKITSLPPLVLPEGPASIRLTNEYIEVLVGRRTILNTYPDYLIGNRYDYNPIHAIWYIITTMLGIPEDFLHRESFLEVAAIVKAEDTPIGMGILFDKEAPAETYIQSILFHLSALIFYDADGKIHIKLIRNTTPVEDMISLSDENFLDAPSIKRGSWAETVNEIKADYPLRIVYTPPIPCEVRLTNNYVEVLRPGLPLARLTNEYVEVLLFGWPLARLTNEYVEVLRSGIPLVRVTHHYVEVLQSY